jgi:hypothetical protein
VVPLSSVRRSTVAGVAGALLCSLALLGHAREAQAPPGFLHEALGPPQADAPLLHHPADGVRVAIKSDRFSVVRGADSVSLAVEAAGNAEWEHFDNGVARTAPFGAETVVVDGEKAEQYLTVTERQGKRTWRWKLQARGLTPRLGADGAVGFLRGHRLVETSIAPVAIFDSQGGAVTPEGLAWTLRREASTWLLELRLDDSALPLPYVIDPAITFQSASSGTNGLGATTITLNAPAGVAQGDLLVAQVTARHTAAPTAPAGWQLVANQAAGSGASAVIQSIFWKAAGGAEPASYTWTWSTSIRASGGILAYSGVDATNPIDAASGGSGSSNLPMAPSVTTTANDAVLVAFFGMNPTVATTFTEPAGMTERYDVQGTGVASESADGPQLLAGPSGPKTAVSLTSGDWTAQLVALRVDATPPAAPVQTISESSADSYAAGATFYYRAGGGSGGPTFTVSSAPSDAESGMAKVTFPGLAGGMTPTTATDDTTAPYSQTYSWSLGATESGAKTVTAVDNAGNSATGQFTIVRDAAGPTGHSVSLSGGPVFTTPSVPLVLSNGTDNGGSGVDPTFVSLWRDSAPLVGGACGSFSGTWFGIALSAGADTGVTPGNCYRYRYIVRDNVGNSSASAISSADAILVNSGVGFHSASSGGMVGTSLTLNKPAGAVVNDLLLAQVTIRSASITITPPAGWTLVRRDDTGSGSNQLGQAVYYRFAGGSEPASYAWTFSGSIDASGGIVSLAGVSPTSPIDVSGGLGGSGTSVTAPSVTTTASNDGLVAFFGSGSSTAFTPPTGMTERYQAGGGQTAVSAADGSQAAVGATGPRTATAPSAASSSPNIGQLVALRKDATPPTTPALTLSEASTDAFASGTTLFYRPAAGGSFTLGASASDGESGLQAIVFPGLSAGFTPTVDFASTSRIYSWTSGAGEAGAKTVTAYDNAGNTATATFSLAPDSEPPAGGSVSYPDGDDADGVVAIATADGTDAGAGVNGASGLLERQLALLVGGLCGSFGAWSAVTSPDTVPPGNCARYRYRVSDHVGNEVVYTSSSVVKVAGGDNTPPSGPVLTLSESEPDEHVAGTTLYYNPSGSNTGTFAVDASTGDAESGISLVEFPAVFGLDGALDPLAPYQTTYAWTATAAAQGDYTVTATNGVTLQASSTFAVVPDTEAPTVSLTQPAVDAPIRDGQTLAATAADSLAGVREVEFAYCPGSTCSFLLATPLGIDTTAPYSVPWTGQPADGEYTVLAAVTDNVGNGAVSIAVRITVDNTAPSSDLAVVEGSRPDLQYFDDAATTHYYNPASSGDLRLTASPSDATGIQVVEFPSVSTPGFTGTGASDGLAPYDSNSYSFNTANIAAPAPVVVVVTDLAGNAGSTELAFVRDTDPPTGGEVSYADGYDADGTVAITTADGTDSGAGIEADSRLLERQTAPLADGSCGAFGGWTSATSPDPLPSGTCARYRYTVADRVANAATFTSSNVVKVDLSAPLAPVLALSESEPDEHADGTTLYYNPSGENSGTFSVTAATSDSESTVTLVSFQSVFGADAATAAAAPYETSYSWTSTATASGAHEVTATNAAGSTASASFTVTPDTWGPDVSLSAPLDGGATREGQAVEAAAFDALAGTAEVEFRYCSGDPCPWDVATPIGADTTAPYSVVWTGQPADGMYSLIARAVDRVGNLAGSTPIAAMVDNTAPTNIVVPTVSFSPHIQHFDDATDTLYYNPEASGGFVLSSEPGDAGSGVAGVDFPRISITGFRGAAASDFVAPFTSNIYSFDDTNAVEPTDATIVVTDVAGNRTTEMLSFERDTAPPTGGFVSYADGYHPTGSVSVEASSGIDAGVGIEGGSAALERETAILEDGVCGVYGPWEPAVSPDSLPDATCARYRHRVSDQVGNEAVYTSVDVVRTDFTPPSAELTDPGASLHGTVDLTANAADAASGVDSLTYQASPAGAEQWTDVAASWDTTMVADGLYDLRVVVSDRAGNTTASAPIQERRVDNAAPGVQITAPVGYVNASAADPYTVEAASPDSDVASVEFFRCDDPSADCATGGWLSLGVDASAPFAASWSLDADGNRALRARAVDATGNATQTVVDVMIDRQAPSNGSLSVSHTTSTWSSDNAVDVAFENPTDATSGMDGFSYQWDADPSAAPDTVKDAEETAGGTTSPPLADGTWYFHLRTADNAGNWSDPVHAGPFLIDANAPTAVATGGWALLRPFNLTRTFTVSWTGGDDASGTAGYAVQYRTAGYDGVFGAAALWQSATTATSASFAASPGWTYCFSARALDAVGNVSPWSAESCTALPLMNTSLAHSTGWRKRTGSGYYMRSYSISSRRGAALIRRGVLTRRIAVIATKCPTCGTLGVYWNGTLLKKINLAASTTRKRQLVTVAGWASPRSGTVKLVVLSSGKPVIVEGLGLKAALT